LTRLALTVVAVVTALAAAMTLGLVAALTPGCSASSGASAAAQCADAGQTYGEQCTTVYTELCKQGARCGTATGSISDCASNAAAQYCCTGSACDDAGACQAPAQVSACASDIDNADCNIIVNFTNTSYTPSDCTPFVTSM
jgi:hypothetical protein